MLNLLFETKALSGMYRDHPYYITMFYSYLEEVRTSGENAAEFFQLYQRLTQPTYWKFYLALQGALLQIGQLLTKVRLVK